MKVLLASILLLVAHQVFAQNFEDGFSDGDFTTNPAWFGADSNFVIFDLDGNNVLRLSDNEASYSYLSTASSNVIGEWEFFVRIDGGAPSNSNRAEIYLMSDIADLDGAVNGYALRIGQTGNDVFTLVRVDAGAQTTILQDTTIFQAGGEYRVNQWSLRGGYRFEESPFQDTSLMGDLTGYSVGLGYSVETFKIDLSYASAQQDRSEALYGTGLTTPTNIDQTQDIYTLTIGFFF